MSKSNVSLIGLSVSELIGVISYAEALRTSKTCFTTCLINVS